VCVTIKRILTGELDVYRRLLELAQRKKKLLLEKFSTELQTIVSEEEECVIRLGDLAVERRAAIAGLIGRDDASLNEVIDHLEDASFKSDLWMLSQQLRDIAAEIRRLNEENQRLLEQALELTQYTIKLMTQVPADVTYKAPGTDKNKPAVSALFDRKA
jgi:flagellar biosynthesis/type III secretory pathway chaperone